MLFFVKLNKKTPTEKSVGEFFLAISVYSILQIFYN